MKEKEECPDFRRRGNFWGLRNILGGSSNSLVDGPEMFEELNPKEQSLASFRKDPRSQKVCMVSSF